MRKIYITPFIEVVETDTYNILAGTQPEIKVNSSTEGGKNGPGIESGDTENNVSTDDFAKGNNHWGLSLDSDW